MSKTAVKVDIDKIVSKARSSFTKKNDLGLAKQLVTGSSIPRPTEPHEFVYWPNSPFHLLIGIPGIPFGRIVQIAGKPDSGKSTHAMQLMKLAQEQGHTIILWDPESKFSAYRFDNFFKGDSNNLLVVTSKLISEGADLVEAYIRAVCSEYPEQKILLVWDSVGGTLAKSEKIDVTDSKSGSKRGSRQMAEAAKENGMAVRGFVSLMEEFKNKETNEDRIGVLLINQTYANIGSVGQKESGGQKVEYHSSAIIQLSRKADIFKTRDKVKRKVGITVRAKARKNHLLESEDSIAEIILDITAGGIKINAKDPAAALAKEYASDEEYEESDEEVEGWGDD